MAGQTAIPQSIKSRGELVEPTDAINLTIQFRDGNGDPIDADAYPQISIVSPSGLVILQYTSAGVTRLGTGNYQFQFTVPINGPFGVFNDTWVGYINGFRVESQFQFVVSHTDLPGVNSDGFAMIGDDPGFNYSQTAILNINKIIKALKARLNSSGKAPSTDSNGNLMYIDCDIYSIDMLATFAAMSLAEFNQIPYFTNFTFEQTEFVDQFFQVLVQGATLYALASKALIERGREFQITDNSISFNPPSVSEMLNTQWSTELTNHTDKLRLIKNSIRPGPYGLGVFGTNNSTNPAIKRMSHRRAGRVF